MTPAYFLLLAIHLEHGKVSSDMDKKLSLIYMLYQCKNIYIDNQLEITVVDNTVV